MPRHLTPIQKAYLRAFDEHLRGEPGARQRMEGALGFVLAERGLEGYLDDNGRPQFQDPLGRLISDMAGEDDG